MPRKRNETDEQKKVRIAKMLATRASNKGKVPKTTTMNLSKDVSTRVHAVTERQLVKAQQQRVEDRRLKYKAEALAKKEAQLAAWDNKEEELKELFFVRLVENNGHRGQTLLDIGVNRCWFQRMILADPDFHAKVLSCFDDAEDTLQHSLFNQAISGHAGAAKVYFARLDIQRARLEFENKINEIKIADISLDKKEALEFAIKELMVTYYKFKANSRNYQALQTLTKYIELLELSEVTDLTNTEVLTGTKLVEIFDSLGFKPDSIQDISFEKIEDEEIKKHYKNMFPQNVIDGTDKKAEA